MPFDAWLAAFRTDALRQGISRDTLDNALTGIQPNKRVLELDRKQPESRVSFDRYRRNVVTAERLRQGRELMRIHAAELRRTGAHYGVQPQYIVALWSIETSFGKNTGGFDIIPALATLAWEGRRAEFFRGELMDALRILDEGHISLAQMRGSWAGAMGQNQFMPSSFMRFAVDGDGDGRKDIWTDTADIFASTANYLSRSGWRGDERWGRAVRLPPRFKTSLISHEIKKPVAEWSRLGVRLPDGNPLPHAPGVMASIVAPDGPHNAFLTYNNFDVFRKWNRSNSFALSAGMIADGIAGP